MSGLVLNGVLGPNGRDRDVEQKQDLDHPANVQLINRRGAAAFTEAHLQAPRQTKARQSLRDQIPSTAIIPKTNLQREKGKQ